MWIHCTPITLSSGDSALHREKRRTVTSISIINGEEFGQEILVNCNSLQVPINNIYVHKPEFVKANKQTHKTREYSFIGYKYGFNLVTTTLAKPTKDTGINEGKHDDL